MGTETEMTLSELLKHGVTEDCSFEIAEEGKGEGYSREYTLYVYLKRLETLEEMQARIIKQLKYMEGYYNHHAKYGKK